MRIIAFHIAEQTDLKKFRSDFTGQLISGTTSELFYKLEEWKYMYIFNYGVVVFSNMTDAEMSNHIYLLKSYSRHHSDKKLREEFEVSVDQKGGLWYEFDKVMVPVISEKVLKISMFNVAQSVVLDFYTQATQKIHGEITNFTLELEEHGKLAISKRNMLRFIGSTLKMKNRVIENLYIFDVPDIVWDDEYLDEIHKGLSKAFDLRTRFREIEYTFKIIEDNLKVFMDITHHRETSLLEIIIILLILIEVIDLFVTKILHVVP